MAKNIYGQEEYNTGVGILDAIQNINPFAAASRGIFGDSTSPQGLNQITGQSTYSGWGPGQNGGSPLYSGAPSGTSAGPPGGDSGPASELHGGGMSPGDAQQRAILAKLQAFADEMGEPLDMNDPYIQNILKGAQGNAMDAAKRRGIQGPMGINQGQQAYIHAAAPLQQAKQGQRLQALSAAGQIAQGAGQLGLQRDQFNYGRQQDQYNSDMNQYNWQQGQRQGSSGNAFGLLGGLGGFALGGFPGAAAGYQAGTNFGGGLGSLGGSPPPRFRGGYGGGYGGGGY